MIRRGFWLLAGAILGVTGYRKVSRLAKLVTGAQVPSRTLGSGARAIEARDPVPLAGRIKSAASFARDVRQGMADYRDLHGRQLGRSLGSERDRVQPGSSSQRANIEPRSRP